MNQHNIDIALSLSTADECTLNDTDLCIINEHRSKSRHSNILNDDNIQVLDKTSDDLFFEEWHEVYKDCRHQSTPAKDIFNG